MIAPDVVNAQLLQLLQLHVAFGIIVVGLAWVGAALWAVRH